MSFTANDLKKELYDAALITVAATAVGFATRKATGESLNTPNTFNGTLKLGLAVGLGAAAVKFLQARKMIPENINA